MAHASQEPFASRQRIRDQKAQDIAKYGHFRPTAEQRKSLGIPVQDLSSEASRVVVRSVVDTQEVQD